MTYTEQALANAINILRNQIGALQFQIKEVVGSTPTGALVASNNLSELTNLSAARTNLGLGSFATKNSLVTGDIPNLSATYLLVASNLSDVPNKTTARSNLGLGSFALKNSLVSGDIPDISATYATQAQLTTTNSNVSNNTTDIAGKQTQLNGTGYIKQSSTTSSFIASIPDGDISSSTTWNAKESALTFSNGVTRTVNAIANDLITGKAGGQTIIGGTASGENLTLASTSNATKGKIFFGAGQTTAYDGVNDWIGIATNAPTHSLTVGSTGTGLAYYNTSDQTTNYERLRGFWSGNVLNFSTENGGSGSLRSMIINSATLTVRVADVNKLVVQGASLAGGVNMSVAASTGGQSIMGIASTFTNSSLTAYCISVLPTVNQTVTGGYTGLWISPFEQATGSGNKYLIDAGTNSAGSGSGTHTSKFSVDNSGNVIASNRIGIGASSPSSLLHINGNASFAYNFGTSGVGLRADAATYTSTTSSGTITNTGVHTLGRPTLAANSSTTLTTAATLYIENSPAAGTNVSVNLGYAINVVAGLCSFNGGFNTGNTNLSNLGTAAGSNSAASQTTAGLQIGGASNTFARVFANGSISTAVTANAAYGNTIIGSAPITTAATGTHAVFANLAVNPIGTITNGGSTPTETATLYINGAGSGGTTNYALHITGSSAISAINGKLVMGGVIQTKGFTVATLPSGTQGDSAFVTDANSPTYGASVAGGGSVVIPVFYNGTNWICA